MAAINNLPENFSIKGDLTNLYIGDFNGDGFDDFLRQEKDRLDNDNNRTADIFFSDGSGGFSRIGLPENFSIKGDLTNLHVGDFNGDGFDDFLRQEKGSFDDDNVNTAHIFFADSNGDFSIDRRTLLPENFAIKGDLTNLHVGDFNGDGFDDVLRQEKGAADDDNIKTAEILVSNGDASFSRFDLPEDFSLKGDQTNLHVGDFDGDGFGDILRQEKGSLDDDNVNTAQIISNLQTELNDDDTLIGNSGNDVLEGGFGNDFIEGREGNDFLDGGFAFLNDSGQLIIEDGGDDTLDGGEGDDGLVGRDGNDLLLGGSGDDTISGTQGFDTLRGGSGDDFLNGDSEDDLIEAGEGNDFVIGGSDNDTIQGNSGDDNLGGQTGNDLLEGGEGNDLLDGGQDKDTLKGGEGNDLLDGGPDADLIEGDLGNDTLRGGDQVGNNIQVFEDGDDTLKGGEGNDLLDGGKSGNDLLEGEEGDDGLKGGEGNDLLNGGSGINIAIYEGKLDDFEISVNDDNTITVVDTNASDGDEGTDTLTDISLLSFDNNTSIGRDLSRNTVLGIAGVHESTDNSDTSTSISGGNIAATNFVIDIEGTTGLGLDFDTTKLASFINDITLPNQDIEDARLASNLLFDAGGGFIEAIPVIGAVGSTSIAIQQVLANYGFDLLQVEAQKQAAIDAINNPDYNTEAWGTITQTNRNLVLIEDFQIGVDNIFLPSVSNVANVGYAIKSGILNNQNGVFIEAQIGTENSNLVFIENNYGSLNNTDFTDQITNLLTSSGNENTDSGSIISTFNQTPIIVQPLNSGLNVEIGTFAGDHIIGEQLAGARSAPGSFELVGLFGDDLIQGSTENDFLNGGFNSATPTFADITYEDDGFDILQGGKGDDELRGGSGNDTLDGGGLIYDENINVTGVIVDDGSDILIGGSGNDTFIFNTPETGIDVITDFTVLVDTIQINQAEFGATDKSEFSFDQTNGALSFASQQIATLANFDQLQGFDVNRDIQFV